MTEIIIMALYGMIVGAPLFITAGHLICEGWPTKEK